MSVVSPWPRLATRASSLCLVAWLVVSVLSTVSCSSSDPAPARICTPGNNVFCRCVDRTEGTKLCNDSGTGFSTGCRLGANLPCPEAPADPPAPPPNQEEVAAACDGYTRSVCANFQRCAPFILESSWGDVDLCARRVRVLCLNRFTGEGSRTTAADVAACAKDALTSSCVDFLEGVEPASCRQHPGDRENGKPCGTNAQCQTFGCGHAGDADCGVCRPLGAENDDCSDKRCAQGLTCVLSKCTKLGRAGEACKSSNDCAGDLVCNGTQCVAPLAAGATCDPSRDLCGSLSGLTCDGASKRCVRFKIAASGSPCGVLAGGITYCAPTTTCIGGSCVPVASDGAACDATAGPECLAPADCVSGKCKAPSSAACP